MSAFGGKADIDQPLAYQPRFMSTRPSTAQAHVVSKSLSTKNAVIHTGFRYPIVQRVLALLQPDWLRMDNADSRSARNTGDRNNDRGLQEVARTISSSGSGNDTSVGRGCCSGLRRRDTSCGAPPPRGPLWQIRQGPRHSRHTRL